MSAYRFNLVKYARRSKDKLAAIQEGPIVILVAHNPQTFRRLYYAGTVRRLQFIAEQFYKMVRREMVKLHLASRELYCCSADNSRWFRQPQTYGGVEEGCE